MLLAIAYSQRGIRTLHSGSVLCEMRHMQMLLTRVSRSPRVSHNRNVRVVDLLAGNITVSVRVTTY